MGAESGMNVKVGISGAAFKSGLEELRGSARKFSGDIKGMFGNAIGAGALVMGLKSVIEKGAEISKLSNQFAVSAREIQIFGKIGDGAGVSMETIAKGLKKLQAAGKSSSYMYELADAVASAKTENEGFTIAAGILGDKMASELMPILRMGGDEMRRVGESAVIMSDEMVANLKRANDQIDGFKDVTTVALGYVAMGLMKGIEYWEKFWAAEASGYYAFSENMQALGQILGQVVDGNLPRAFDLLKKFPQEVANNCAVARAAYKETWDDISKKYSSTSPQPPAKPQGKEIDPNAASKAKTTADLLKQLSELRERSFLDEASQLTKINFLRAKYNQLLLDASSVSGDEQIKKQIEAEKTLAELHKAEEKWSEDSKKHVKESEDGIEYGQNFANQTKAEQLRGAGKDYEADQLERQAKKEELIKQLQDKARAKDGSKLSYEDASKLAEERLGAEDKKKESDAKKGYSDELQSRRYAKMSDAEKVEDLKGRSSKLEKEAAAAEAKGDKTGAYAKRTEAVKLGEELDQLLSKKDPKNQRTAVTVDSKRAIGAGGGMGAITDRAQSQREKQTSLLERIAKAVESDDQGGGKVSTFAP